MPRRMAEVLIQLHPTQHASCRLIHLSGRHSRCYGSDRSFLRFQHRIIHVPFTRHRLAHVHGTRHTARISVENNTEIQRHEPTLRQLRTRSPATRPRPSQAATTAGFFAITTLVPTASAFACAVYRPSVNKTARPRANTNAAFDPVNPQR